MSTITTWKTIEPVNCCECGTVFGLESQYKAARKADHKAFYCPNGHPLCFGEETEVDRLRRNVTFWQERARDQEKITRQERKRAESMKGQVTRIRNRISAGVCPDCNRTFRNLARHMTCKHGAKP